MPRRKPNDELMSQWREMLGLQPTNVERKGKTAQPSRSVLVKYQCFSPQNCRQHIPAEGEARKSEGEKDVRDLLRSDNAVVPFICCLGFTECKLCFNCRFLSQFLPLDVPRNFAFYWRLSGECRLCCAGATSFCPPGVVPAGFCDPFTCV